MRLLLFPSLFLMVAALHGAEPKPPAPRQIFSATVQKTPISIYLARQPFDPARHQVTEMVEKDGHVVKSATVDGREVLGTDQMLPKAGLPQLARLYVNFGGKRVEVPERLLSHVFIPDEQPANFDHRYGATMVSVSANGRAVFISLKIGDGGGTGTYSLYVGVDGTCTHEEPARPEP